MKTLAIVLEDYEFEKMKAAKKESGMNWHDYLIDAVAVWVEQGDEE